MVCYAVRTDLVLKKISVCLVKADPRAVFISVLYARRSFSCTFVIIGEDMQKRFHSKKKQVRKFMSASQFTFLIPAKSQIH